MIRFILSDNRVDEQRVDAYAVIGQDSTVMHSYLNRFNPYLAKIVEQRSFHAKAGSSLVVTGIDKDRPVYLFFVGAALPHGKLDDRLEAYRRAAGSLVRMAEQVKISSLAVWVAAPESFAIGVDRLIQEVVTSMTLASYHCDTFFTERERKHRDLEVTLCVRPDDIANAEQGRSAGERIGHAVNQARSWCDLPANVLTPTALADNAKAIAQGTGLGIKVFNESDIIAMGMGGLEAVSKGSAQECRLVILEYKSDKPNAPTLAIVGKGITFDSGGLSIKPAAGMETMKDDMAGAAAVISTMEALSYFKPAVNVIALAPISENLPSGTATKPGDVIRFYNGMTAEVKNTDAEGRLILADALAYVVKNYAVDGVISLATLTGSCAYALGPFFCGLMSQSEELSADVLVAASRSGDRAWPLPFHDDYKAAVRSDIADLCNIGQEKYRAGAITAGFFLKPFVGDKPFVHLDIAGTAFNVPDISYYRPGATGFGVRLLIDLLRNWR
jgi:leucyl aminopeptidase